MKQAHVLTDQVYLTRISGELCPVTVLRGLWSRVYGDRSDTYGRGRMVLRFEVERNGLTLPKLRTAAALRELTAK